MCACIQIYSIYIYIYAMLIRGGGVDQHGSLPLSWYEDICGHTRRNHQQRVAGTSHIIQ